MSCNIYLKANHAPWILFLIIPRKHPHHSHMRERRMSNRPTDCAKDNSTFLECLWLSQKYCSAGSQPLRTDFTHPPTILYPMTLQHWTTARFSICELTEEEWDWFLTCESIVDTGLLLITSKKISSLFSHTYVVTNLNEQIFGNSFPCNSNLWGMWLTHTHKTSWI